MNVLVLTHSDLILQAYNKNVENIDMSDFKFSERYKILRSDLVLYEFEKNIAIKIKCRWE